MVNGIERFWSILKRRGGGFLNQKPVLTITKHASRPTRIFISHKHKFVYYAVPKAAHTTIKFFIITIDEIGRGSAHGRVHSTNIPRIVFPENRSSKYKDYFHFTFVRNPYDRLLSCYIEKVYNPALSNRIDHAFINGENLEFVKAYGNSVGFKKMSFSGFVHFVTQIPDEHCDPHFAPQHSLLDLETLDFIGRLENFDQDFSYIKEQISLSDDVKPEKLMATKHGPYQNYYDDELRRMVAEKYARDLEIFNYDFI